MYRIESLLSARLFIQPKLYGEKIIFLSNLSGHISLYAMQVGGSIPEPLLPPHIALQNPHLMDGDAFAIFPSLGKILLMLDQDGDEVYQPVLVPIQGGYPEPAFGAQLKNYRLHMGYCDPSTNLVYLVGEALDEPMMRSFQGDLASGALTLLGESQWGSVVAGVESDHQRVAMFDSYTNGDHVIYLWERGQSGRRKLYGVPLEERIPGQKVPLNSIANIYFPASKKGLFFITSLFADGYGLGYLSFEDLSQVQPVEAAGLVHQGLGELESLKHLYGEHYLLVYNIDGCSWVYEGKFDEAALQFQVEKVLVGQGELSNGVLESIEYEAASGRYALAFSTATRPTQIYTLDGANGGALVQHTHERPLGIPQGLLSAGEDASYTSFDGTRISARLYLPAPELGFNTPRPLVYYIHGGPQSQERPDFAWFSMPLIQFLTLNGFAVFVPNVRGSSGYGLSYTTQVDRDWGGKDRLDHVHAMQQVLSQDSRLDVHRAAVVGRSYGGYMTLTLAGRHPDLWQAAVDMFGPFDLFTFLERIPETWKPYFSLTIGDAEKDRDLLIERSPRTHLGQLGCPMLVIQGKNDPRVTAQESLDLVENLRAAGKTIDYLQFDNEGHDVLKFENRVRAYNAITDFFKRYLTH